MGRAARNVNGTVVLYADEPSGAMESAIQETRRRRQIQRTFNEDHGHEPRSIEKEVSETNLPGSKTDTGEATSLDPGDESDAAQAIERLEARMQEAADNLEFELAADIRDRIRELREEFDIEGEEGVPAPSETGVPSPHEDAPPSDSGS
jgi:excinuclease ABC subunit B